ncbi:unnamed protein product [Porites evermanni]|uniref:Huntingtin interacting protein 1 n=1 Tax=Porites evermanni TaxID=104178 RepID=A0ABN8LYW8_9CNID|nr:unnamed protein product [Porites evermanni]
MCWKAMLVIHKLLREGHPNALKESLKYKQMLKDMKEFWKHSTKGGYGWLIHSYLAVIVAKLDFHNKNESIPGTLRNSDGGPIVYSGTDVNDYFELSVDIFDYLDTLVDLEKRVFSTLDPFRASSQLQAVQCRICPFPVIIQECGGLYDIVVDIMYKLHASLPADTLVGHRDRFYAHFAELKKFFFDAGNMAYVKALVPVPVLPQNPPSFTLSDPKPVLARTKSFEGPPPKSVPTDDFKRQSLMEPLTVPIATESFVQSTPQTPEADILGLNATDGPQPDNRDLIIYQLRQEIAQLKLALERQQREVKAIEDSLRSQIARLTDELDEYKTIAEKTCEENVLLRKDLETKDDDKKDQKGTSEEKFNKLKGMYGKLREEHIQLLRTNAEVKQKLSGYEREKEELSQANEKLQQEVDDKSTELLRVFQKFEMAEQNGKLASRLLKMKQKIFNSSDIAFFIQRAGDEVERLAEEYNEKIASLMDELETLKKERSDTEEARKITEAQIESMKKDHEEKVAALQSDLTNVQKGRTDEEAAKRTAEEAIERERNENKEKVTELEKQRQEELMKQNQDLVGMAIETAERTIQDTLDHFANPKHSSTTCTADYLLSRIESLPGVVDELNSKFTSYQQDYKGAAPCACCIGSFSHQLSECILNAKATSHMAPTQESADLQSFSVSAGRESLELLALYKQTNPDPNAIADKVNSVKKQITDIIKVAEALAPKEKDNMDSIGGEVEDEINATAELVADSAARIEEMINKSREKYTGVQLEVNGRILDSCTALMEAIKKLIMKSKVLQKEIVDEGRPEKTTDIWRRYHWFPRQMTSEKRALKFYIDDADSADKVVQGQGKFEEIVVASNEITASTVQLVAASRVKARQASTALSGLQGASRNVVESAAGVVASAKTGAEMIEDSKAVPDYSKLTLTQAKRLEMESQVRVLELESQVTKERQKLGDLRRAHYQLAGVEEGLGTE